MSDKDIQKIYEEFHVPKHIIRHMKKVAKFALEIAKKFQGKNIKIDLELVKSAALLHDSLRVCDFRELDPEKIPQDVSEEDLEVWQKLREKYGKKGHSEAIAEILEQRGWQKLAMTIRNHDFGRIDELKSYEDKIVYYADKRVEEDYVVALKERFSNGRIRNYRETDNLEEISKIEQKAFQLEKELSLLIGDIA